MIQLTIGAIVHLMATKTALNIDKGLVGRVAAILGTKGTTETIDAALRDVESRESRRELLDELSSLADEDLEWIEKCWDEH